MDECSADIHSLADRCRLRLKQFSALDFAQVAVLLALLAALYWRVVIGLVNDWWNDPNYSHGMLVPLFSGYLIWMQREKLQNVNVKGNWIGLPVILAGLGALIIGEIGAEFFTMRISFIIVLAGLVLFHLGTEVFKALFFPLVYLVFMIPLPSTIFYAIAFPLQGLAAQNAAWLLDMLGIPVLLDGNVIQLSNTSLGVTEACSGIRSLISLLALAVAWSYVTFKSRLSRAILIASAIPITIVANAGRVVITGIIAYWFGVQYAEGFYHTLAGWLIFLVAFAGLFGVYGLMRLFKLAR